MSHHQPTLPFPGEQARDFEEFLTPELLEERLHESPIAHKIADNFDLEREVPEDAGRTGRREMAQTMTSSAEVSFQVRLNTLLRVVGVNETIQLLERVVKERIPKRFQVNTLKMVRGLHDDIIEAGIEEGPYADDATTENHESIDEAFHEYTQFFGATTEGLANSLEFLALADTHTRREHRLVDGILKHAVYLDKQHASEIKRLCAQPTEAVAAELYRRKAAVCFSAGEVALTQLVDFTKQLTGNDEATTLQRMLELPIDLWPNAARLAVNSKVQEVAQKALTNYQSIESELELVSRYLEELLDPEGQAIGLLYDMTQLEIRNYNRNNQLAIRGRGRMKAISVVPQELVALNRFLNGESNKRRATAQRNEEGTEDIEVAPIAEAEPRPLIACSIQNLTICSNGKTVEDIIQDFTKRQPEAARLRELLNDVLQGVAKLDMTRMVGGLKQLEQAKGRVRDETGAFVKLFEVKPTELQVGVPLGGKLMRQTRLLISLNNDGSLGLISISKRDQLIQSLRNLGIT